MEVNVNNEELIFDAQQYDRMLMDQIRQSQHEILISCYIVDFDEFSQKVFDALLERAKSGIKIQVVVDGLGSWSWINDHAQRYKHGNLDIRVYHPLTWKLLGVSLKNFFHGMNRRNHHKLFIFDQKIACNGSRNINDTAMIWRETNILIDGPSVSTLCALFAIVWQRSHDRWTHRYRDFRKSMQAYKKLKGSEHVLSTHTFALRRKNQKIMIGRLKHAKSEIQITTPYFFPTRKVFKVLLKKRKEGVKVSVLLPRVSDVIVSKWITQYHYKKMLGQGVELYEYTPSILHAKSMLIDDWGLIGTSNMNRRSVYRDLEIDYIVSQPDTVENLRRKFFEDVKDSLKISSIPRLGFFKNVIVWIATKIFSSWF